MITERAKLQELKLPQLRDMATAVDVDHDGLQKSKLIAAILEADKFDPSMLPEDVPETVKTVATEAAAEGDSAASESESSRDGDGSNDDRQGRNRNRRNRNRNRNRNREPVDESELELRQGILDILPEGYGFLRVTGYLPGDKDVYVAANIVRKSRLRKGDIIEGPIRPARAQEKFPALVRAAKVNGLDPEEAADRPKFAKLTPLFPDQRLRLEVEGHSDLMMARIIDLISPIGKGQRGLIVSPPKAGKTTVLKDIANSIAANNPECYLMVVLVDERPEEVTDMARNVNAEVISSTFDEPAERHVRIANIVLEKAKRMVECGHDVVILLDSITRLARAYNTISPASGKVLSGGVDANALHKPKRFFGAARNIEGGGSLTILATALTETGSKMDEVIFEEFKGTGNMELQLDRKLSNKRVYPSVDVNPSSTRREDLLLDKPMLDKIWILRNYLSDMNSVEAMQFLRDRLVKTGTNEEFLISMNSD